MGPMMIHAGRRERERNTARCSLVSTGEQKPSRARVSRLAFYLRAKNQRLRNARRCHRIVRLSPCFCTHWPLCRPKDATKLNKPLHCTVDGAGRSLAIQEQERNSSRARRATRAIHGSAQRQQSRVRSADRSTSARAWPVEHFACCEVLTEGDDVRSLIPAS